MIGEEGEGAGLPMGLRPPEAVMRATDVLEVLDIIAGARAKVWLGGGWGADALVGRQTRGHDDLDLAFPSDQEARIVETLAGHGFHLQSDWRPVKFVLADQRGRRVDLHPVTFDVDGNGVQANVDGAAPFRYPAHGFSHGLIGVAGSPCIGLDVQLLFHQGYEPRDVDRHELSLLEGLARGCAE